MERLNKISKIFNKIYYNLFVENFKGKLHYNFPQNYFRWDLIEYLINKYGYSDYLEICLLYTSPSPRDISGSRMPSSA